MASRPTETTAELSSDPLQLCADLDLITMWFIELPEGTSLWEYTSVRSHRLAKGAALCVARLQ